MFFIKCGLNITPESGLYWVTNVTFALLWFAYLYVHIQHHVPFKVNMEWTETSNCDGPWV